MQSEPVHKVEQPSRNSSVDTMDDSSSPPPTHQVENPEKALLELFRESKESPQAFIIQLYFYGGIAIVGLCAAIFLMMTLA
jgi:hypothetical protein